MLWLPIDRTSHLPLIRQLYLELRRRILAGELGPGYRLPASRQLAVHLGISRNVVLEVYEQLIAEGYLQTRTGSGTYVALGARWEQPAPAIEPSPLSPTAAAAWIDFRSGLPALDQFPRKLWGQLAKQVCSDSPADRFGYGSPEGSEELRTTLVGYLRRTRGVVCQADQLVITSGAAQAFSLVGKLLLSPGDAVALEDPAAPEVRAIFSALGAVLQGVPVDGCGLQPDCLPASSPRFILVTPSHQFPLGSVLTIQRRIQLLQYARDRGSYVVEDDYDSEFRYMGTPVSSLQGLDPNRVIYVGSFSKILAPALRLGYLVLPADLIAACRQLKRLTDIHSSTFEQLTLVRFMQTGSLDRHIVRMRKLYRQRRDALRRSLVEQFSQRVRLLGDSTGLHLVAEVAGVDFSVEQLRQIEHQLVRVYPVSLYASAGSQYREQIVMGFGNLAIAEIQLGVQRLKQALN